MSAATLQRRTSLVLLPDQPIPRLDGHTVKVLRVRDDVRTTMSCTHVMNRGEGGVRSPADGLVRDAAER